METVELKIQEARTMSLDYDYLKNHNLSPLHEFFQFSRYPRKFSDPAAIKDCFFYNLYITYYVSDWGQHSPPPHPGIFEEFFPEILRRLTGTENTLTLFVKSLERDYFNELEVIENLLAPRNINYILLPNPILPGDRRTQIDVGNLIFEWPLDSLDHIVREWFMSPMISIEGYISQGFSLARIVELYFQPDTEERIRSLLHTIEIGFRVWPDNNGIFLVTSNLDDNALKQRLHISDLNQSLQETVRHYGTTA